MQFKRRRLEDKAEDDRQKMILYEKLFSSSDGHEVLLDLMNRFHVLNSHGGDNLKEGQRSVVLDIMARASVDLVQFDKLLKGEI